MAARRLSRSKNRDQLLTVQPRSKLELQGFNNLTKSLSFNLYDICFAARPETVAEYISYIDEVYNADRLTDILTEVTQIIDAEVLNVARQDYHPQGASVTMLIAEEPIDRKCMVPQNGLVSGGLVSGGLVSGGLVSQAVVGHLDKSHICVHTYPESHPHNGLSTFRADIDVATCGKISPLKALNFLLNSFESDIVTIDYRVRGFTRDGLGFKHYIDHDIYSIQEFIDPDILADYQAVDVNVYQENIFHTKLLLKDMDLDNYLFGEGIEALDEQEVQRIASQVRREMSEIYYARNID